MLFLGAPSDYQEAERYTNADWSYQVSAIKPNYTLFISFTTTHQGPICFADSLSGVMPLLIVGALGAPSDYQEVECLHEHRLVLTS